jgi:adenylate cyclase
MAKQAIGNSGGDGDLPASAEVRAALDRILRSRCFEHAGRASDFLRFVVGKTLAGEGDQLKGHTIAIYVFGRPPSFDAQSDPLVRVEALRLRQRLTEYYAGEGAADPVRLDLPRGSYAVKAKYSSAAAARTDDGRPQLASLTARLLPRARAGWAAAAVLLVGSAGALVFQRDPPVAVPVPTPPPELSHVTKVAVVPFENLSGTPDFDRLAAGLTEEVMVRLDELDLYVIATQSGWYRPGQPLDGMLGHEHSYLLTGSVRESSGGARITVRIIAADGGRQIWSTAYDEPPGIEQQPALQAKVARDVAAAAAPFGPIFAAELELARREAHTLELPDCQRRYLAFRRTTDPASFPDAAACFQSLVERRPELAHAWAGVAMTAIDEHLYYSGSAADREAPLARAWEAAHKALALDSNDVVAIAALARAQFYSDDPAYIETAERALALEPTNVDVTAFFAILLTARDDVARGLEMIARAEALSPRPRPAFKVAYAYAALRSEEPCKAQAAAADMESPNWFITYVLLGASAALCGDEETATAARRRLLALWPDFETEGLTAIRNWRLDPALEDTVLRGLRKAGLELRASAPAVSRGAAAD